MAIVWAVPITKKRTVSNGPVFVSSTRSNTISPWVPYTYQPIKTETCWTYCHTGWWQGAAGTDTDVGGEFALTRTGVGDHIIAYGEKPSANNAIRGALTMEGLSSHSPSFIDALESRTALNVFGTHAVAETIPTNPHASLSTLVGELKRGGLPNLPGSSLKDRVFDARGAGSEWLNLQFGILPLIDDLKKFALAVVNANRIIEQFMRDSDRKIRRRWAPPMVRETHVFDTNLSVSYISRPNAGPAASRVTCSCSRETQFSFSGAFRYHVPVSNSMWSELKMMEAKANVLLGTRLTPSLLWELAPWSWATDWFTNTGDIVHNISQLGSDGLVMQYGYAMRHQRVRSVQRAYINTTSAAGSFAGATIGCTILSERKQRVRANPYGFGVDDTSLTPKQLSILAALGLTRGRRDPDFRAPHP